MYGLIGRMVAVPGERDNLIAILLEGTRHMPGCLSYSISEDAASDDSIWITEVWDGKESHEASLSLPSVREAISRGRPLIAEIRERFETNPVLPREVYKPIGHSSVSPYLIVRDASSTVEMLEIVFGASELRRIRDKSDRIMHTEIRIDDSVIMMGGAVGNWHPVPAHVHIYVPDVDEVYRRALAAGLEPVQKPVQKDEEDRRGGVKDRDGITWWISTRVASAES